MTQTAIRTVTARYDGIRTQMKEKPYKFKDVYTNKWHCVYRTLDWLQKPVLFSRPQADLVRNRDYVRVIHVNMQLHCLNSVSHFDLLQ